MENIPQNVRDALALIEQLEPQIEQAKATLLEFTKQHGSFCDQESDRKVSLVSRTTVSLNKEKVSDYFRDKVRGAIILNRENVLEYAKTTDLERAGLTIRNMPECFQTKTTEYVRIGAIPVKEKK